MSHFNPTSGTWDLVTDDETHSENDSDNDGTTESMDTDVTDEELSSIEEIIVPDDEDQGLTNPAPMNEEGPSQQQQEPLSDKFKCPVCLISFENLTTLAITCGHVLCETCVDTLASYRRYNCPVCKRRFRRSHSKTIYF